MKHLTSIMLVDDNPDDNFFHSHVIKKAYPEIEIIIKDDGIGREKSKALKTNNQKKYKSTGLENVSKRIALINELYGKNYKIEVSNLNENMDDKGTLVEIKIPVDS